jgi:hypothetical protein
MMRQFTPTLAFLAAVGLPVPAQAQILEPESQTGSILPVKPRALDPTETAIIRKGFAQCIYRRAKRKALDLLAHSDMETIDLPAAGIRNLTKELSLDDCLGEQARMDQATLGLKFPVTNLRDLLAEEAYLATNRVAPVVAADAAPIVFKPVSTGNALESAQALTTFADCTVRQNAAGADALLRTTPASQAERAAAGALAPTLGQCLVAGQKLTLKPANIRALMAFAMWSRFGRREAGQ